MSRLLIFGLGYTAARLAARLRGEGWQVVGTTRDGRGETIAFDDEHRVRAEIAAATHLLSSVPPADGGDPVLARYGATLHEHRGGVGYLDRKRTRLNYIPTCAPRIQLCALKKKRQSKANKSSSNT